MNILVADNDPRVRAALHMFFSCEPELAIVGESADAASLLAQAKTLNPDLILIDWELPGHSTKAVIEWLKASEHTSKVIVLAKQPESEQAALAVGADAFVSKTHSADSLLDTLRKLYKPREKDSVTANT
jgi:DNA-binding NarL/FixJ family response regulator